MAQTTLSKYNNKNLFSNYYLDKRVKTIAEWKKNDHIAAFSEIKKLYDEERKSFENFNEAQLIKHFLDPIFKILLFDPETEEAAGSEFPDFALFKDKNSRDEAHKNKGTISFYTNVLAIGEAKKWDADLDGKPVHQIRNYLDVTEKKWGILTNGRKWRLFCKEKKRDEYYEVDLPSLLDNNDVEGFKYFFYFFRCDTFLPLQENFLENVLRESEVHAKDIGDNLKENVYRAMKKIADGFFGRPQNNLDKNDGAAQELVQKNTMLLLYRLLFLLYAEDRNLLDLTNPKYLNNHSFRRIKKEVNEKRGRIEQGYDSSGTTIWDRLKSLFELINVGSEAIGEKEFHVPAYNGGLFDTKKNLALDEKWKIGDTYLAEAIHLLTWSGIKDGGFVDYSELEIRHLGSIYEGLLEYKLKVAESDIVTKENEWVSIDKYNEGRKQKKAFEEFDEFSRTRKGELYLATDKGERKATGSYYTPDYIVNYIVTNTVGPVVDEKWKDAEAKKQSFVDTTLSVKVLDPAMGSGHFLVGAVEFLAEKLLKAAQKDIEAGRMVDEPHFSYQDWARREVVAHCIYGVDLNPMAVELAKVGLWLSTISKEKPLSFLDHRLKQGNSLIGARLENLHKYPDVKAKKEEKKVKDSAQQTFEVEIERPFFDKIVKILNSLTDINDDSIENIHRKKDIFEKFTASPEYQRIKALANLHTAIYFGVVTTEFNKQPKDGYYKILWALRKDEEGWRKDTNREWFGKARKLAQEKSFFHWELEFPEIFFEGGAPKENPGWDAVVGNPPYVNAIGLNKTLSEYEKPFWKQFFKSASGAYDLYILFIELGIKLTRKQRLLSLITPNKFLSAPYAVAFREYFCQAAKLLRLLNLSHIHVFEDPSVYPIITVIENSIPIGSYDINIEIPLSTQSKSDSTVLIQNSENLTKLPENIWGFLISENLSLILKGERISVQLQSCCTVRASSTAAEADAYESALIAVDGENSKKFINTGLIDRYNTLWGIDSLTHKGVIFTTPYLDLSNPAVSEERKIQYGKPKIVFAKMAKRVEAFLDEKGEFASANTNFIYDSEYDLRYLLAILNSNLMSTLYGGYFGALIMSGGYFQFQAPQLRVLPIRRISFTTPPARRAALFEEAKALYSAEAPDNAKKLLDFVGARLEAKPEESDVVHDILAHLAERMIEMNKEKNAEIKSFLSFLKGEIGASIDDLSNKTAIQEYYSHEFQILIDVIVKNKKKLKAGYDPKDPDPYKHLLKWYTDSVGKLAPLIGRIEATDGLIDQIVYKLYGLTADEITIVEGSIKTTTNPTKDKSNE